jgi:hypothetical protein
MDRTSADRRAAPRSIGTTARTAVAIHLVALTLTVGTVARAIVGRDGALVIASIVLGFTLLAWAALALVDHHRRSRNRLGAAGS